MLVKRQCGLMLKNLLGIYPSNLLIQITIATYNLLFSAKNFVFSYFASPAFGQILHKTQASRNNNKSKKGGSYGNSTAVF